MFAPVLVTAKREISNSPRLLSLEGWWCFPPLGSVGTMRFRVVGHKREEICISMIFPSHVLPAGGRRSILGPWTLTSIFAVGWIVLDLAIIPIVAALAIPMAVMVLNVSLVFGIKLEIHRHKLDY